MLDEESASPSRSGFIKTPDVDVIPGTTPPAAPPVIATISKKKKLKREDIMFCKRQNETLIKKPGDVNGSDFKIADLDNCVVFLLDHTAQIMMDRCKNTKFYIGPVKSSIFVRNCTNCEITVACS